MPRLSPAIMKVSGAASRQLLKKPVSIICFLMFFFPCVLPAPLPATDTPEKPVHYDSLVAELRIIQEMNAPDSLKRALVWQTFSKFHTDVNEFQAFWQSILNSEPEVQLQFFKRVEKIITSEMTRRPFQLRAPKPSEPAKQKRATPP